MGVLLGNRSSSSTFCAGCRQSLFVRTLPRSFGAGHSRDARVLSPFFGATWPGLFVVPSGGERSRGRGTLGDAHMRKCAYTYTYIYMYIHIYVHTCSFVLVHLLFLEFGLQESRPIKSPKRPRQPKQPKLDGYTPEERTQSASKRRLSTVLER